MLYTKNYGISAPAGMPPHNSTRVSSLLHYYRLGASQTQRLAARSDLHDGAHVRMHPDDVEALARPADSLRPIVALFSTASVAEAVCLRSAETVYVRPGRPRTGVVRGEARSGSRRPAAPLPTAPPPPPAADAERIEWVPLRVSASHAYVRGLRVSGTIHRAVVRLVRET